MKTINLIIKLLLAFCQKEDDNYVIYIKGLPIAGDIKVLFKKVDTMREPSGIADGIDIFTAGKLGVWRFTFVDGE